MNTHHATVPPVIWIPNQLERAYVGQDEVTLRCQTEAFPDSINYWTNTDGTMLKPGQQVIPADHLSDYHIQTGLDFDIDHLCFDIYQCTDTYNSKFVYMIETYTLTLYIMEILAGLKFN